MLSKYQRRDFLCKVGIFSHLIRLATYSNNSTHLLMINERNIYTLLCPPKAVIRIYLYIRCSFYYLFSNLVKITYSGTVRAGKNNSIWIYEIDIISTYILYCVNDLLCRLLVNRNSHVVYSPWPYYFWYWYLYQIISLFL